MLVNSIEGYTAFMTTAECNAPSKKLANMFPTDILPTVRYNWGSKYKYYFSYITIKIAMSIIHLILHTIR